MSDILLGKFDRSSKDEVRVALREFNGNQYLDIRLYFTPEGGGERQPTKRGVALNPRLLPELKKAVLKAEEVLARR